MYPHQPIRYISIKTNVSMSIQGECINNKDTLAKKCYDMFIKTYNNDYSDIIKNFYGISVSLILCKNNQKRLSITPEPFCLLNLPQPEKSICYKTALTDCLQIFSSE